MGPEQFNTALQKYGWHLDSAVWAAAPAQATYTPYGWGPAPSTAGRWTVQVSKAVEIQPGAEVPGRAGRAPMKLSAIVGHITCTGETAAMARLVTINLIAEWEALA